MFRLRGERDRGGFWGGFDRDIHGRISGPDGSHKGRYASYSRPEEGLTTPLVEHPIGPGKGGLFEAKERVG